MPFEREVWWNIWILKISGFVMLYVAKATCNDRLCIKSALAFETCHFSTSDSEALGQLFFLLSEFSLTDVAYLLRFLQTTDLLCCVSAYNDWDIWMLRPQIGILHLKKKYEMWELRNSWRSFYNSRFYLFFVSNVWRIVRFLIFSTNLIHMHLFHTFSYIRIVVYGHKHKLDIYMGFQL